jgi:NADPH-dependent 7-cyano-7-deazaguanine reductase QueF
VKACDPIEITITGEFAPRGGLGSTMQASYTKTASKRGKRGRGR